MRARQAALARQETPVLSEPAQRPFRLAVLSIGLPCPGQKRGGIEQVAHDLSNALVERGHAVTVFTYDPAPATARYAVRPLPFRRFALSWFGRRIVMGYLANVLALLPDYGRVDAIIAHGDSLLLPLRGKPVVRVMHGTAWEEARSATSIGRAVLQAGVYLQELLTALLQRGTVGVSGNTRRFNPFVRHVIPNGINRHVFVPNPAARSPHPTLLFVGALTGRKRGQWLIDGFVETIRPRFKDAELHMVTTPGPQVDGVHYHTGVSTDELVRLYQSAWIYVSPSTYEGFGLPYLEALACGVPIVATSNPGSREVLDEGRYGRLASDETFMSEVADLLGDERMRAALVRTGLVRAGEYDIGRTAQAYEQLIDRLVASHA